jgi:hypothetical protein
MLSLPTKIVDRRDRAAARRGYHDAEARLNDLIGDLYEIGDRDERAELLEAAAAATDTLAALHALAWGEELSQAGRPRAEVLTASAVLLRQVAATERAVISTWCPARPAGLPTGADHMPELWVWASLAQAGGHGHRADLLSELEVLAGRRVGADAAAVLSIVAASEAHLATGRLVSGRDDEDLEPTPRLLVAALLMLAAVIALVPDLAVRQRFGLLMVVLAAFYGALWLVARLPVRRWW